MTRIRPRGGDLRKQQQDAERSVLLHIVKTPMLINEVMAAVDLDGLTTEIPIVVGLIEEFPSLCATAGVLAVAQYIGLDKGVIDLLTGLTYLPEWVALDLPDFSSAIRFLTAPAPYQGLGALAQWRAEVTHGNRGQRPDIPATWHFDSLWKAACYEANAQEAYRQGLRSVAHDCLQSAITILADKPVSYTH